MGKTIREAGSQDGAQLGAPYVPYSPHPHHPEGSLGSWSEGGAMAQQLFARSLVENKKSLFHITRARVERRQKTFEIETHIPHPSTPPSQGARTHLSLACAGVEPA